MKDLRDEVVSRENKDRALSSQRFFKTGKGQYGEGDIFLGLSVPECREIAKKYKEIDLEFLKSNLKSKFHEERLISLLILVEKYKENSDKRIVDFYLDNLVSVNNWDLVDLSADKILGKYLIDKDKKVLYDLSKSENLWEKRISIVSTYEFIKNNKFDDTLKISKILLKDKHDLIHKAVGWMLREIGKKDEKVLENFLKENYSKLPRTTLRYAIERFSKEKREKYLKNKL